MSDSSTVISKKAVGKVITEALRSVPGCIKHSSGFDRITGRELPRFDIDLEEDNRACAVEVHIAVRWPSPVTAVAVTVREVVAGWIEASTKIPVVSVAVTVVDVVPNAPDEPVERITAAELDATPRTPRFTPIVANPITGRDITVNRLYPNPLHPEKLESVPLTAINVDHSELTTIDAGNLAQPWSPETLDSAEVVSISSDVPDRELAPIVTDHTEVTEQLTPMPIKPTIMPVAPSSANRVTRISTDVPAPKLTKVQVNSKPKAELYTPTPITPSHTPVTNRRQVIHLADNIDVKRSTAPITVDRRNVLHPTATPLATRDISTNRRDVLRPTAQPLQARQPSAQPLQNRPVTTDKRGVTSQITVNRTELRPITVDRENRLKAIKVERQAAIHVEKEGER